MGHVAQAQLGSAPAWVPPARVCTWHQDLACEHVGKYACSRHLCARHDMLGGPGRRQELIRHSLPAQEDGRSASGLRNPHWTACFTSEYGWESLPESAFL